MPLKVKVFTLICSKSTIVIYVIGVNDTNQEVEQACYAAALVIKPCWEIPIRLFPSRCVNIFPVTSLSIVFQTTEVRLVDL